MVAARIPTARMFSWFRQRRLYQRTPADITMALAKSLFARTWAAGCAFGSMLLVAWIAAFTRAVFGDGWSGFRTLSAAALSNASVQASRSESDLVPVLAVWAAFVLLAPVGYAVAFRGAAVGAATLGALNFAPPSFLVTPEVARFARGLAQFPRSWNGIWLFIASALAAYFLHQSALSSFARLDQFASRPVRRPVRAAPARIHAGRGCSFALALAVLLGATWSGTVLWLAATNAHGDGMSYGLRGGLVQSDYLLALAIVAALVAYSQSAQGWLLAATCLAAVLGAVANVSPVPHDLAVGVGFGVLTRIGTAWGGSSLWIALFAGFPACLLGVYLVARVRPSANTTDLGSDDLNDAVTWVLRRFGDGEGLLVGVGCRSHAGHRSPLCNLAFLSLMPQFGLECPRIRGRRREQSWSVPLTCGFTA
jgi:hypothetical protein